MIEWTVESIRDVLGFESTAGIVLVMTVVGAMLGGGAGFFFDKRYRKAEEQRLLETSPKYENRYNVDTGPVFRIDTLDVDLRKVGIRFDGMSPPQAQPTPANDTVPMEYFQLKNGTYLRTQWRGGAKMSASDRALAERVILAHEARLK